MMSDNKILMKYINAKDEVEYLRVINHRIDDILETRSNKQETLEALMCHFEGSNNTAPTIATIAISYAIFCSIFPIIIQSLMKDYQNTILTVAIIIVLFVVGGAVTICAWIMLKQDYRKAFIHKALDFKLNQLKTMKEEKYHQNSSEPDEEYEHVYTVTVRSR